MSKGKGSGIGAKMAGGNSAAGRVPDDFYATPEDVTRALIREYPKIAKMAVWEPCAGNGMMAGALVAGGVTRILCTDIIQRQPVVPLPVHLSAPVDVFTVTTLPAGVDAVITNPPFMLAPKMIEHILCLDGGPPQFLALVLKATFWHAARRYPLFQKHPPTAIHPLLWRPDFQNLGAPTMEVMWCVWDRDEADCEPVYVPLQQPDR